jgi:hypothetical protein
MSRISLWFNAARPHYAVGLMSGTSHDGVSAALVAIDDHSATPTNARARLIAFKTYSYPDKFRARLMAFRPSHARACRAEYWRYWQRDLATAAPPCRRAPRHRIRCWTWRDDDRRTRIASYRRADADGPRRHGGARPGARRFAVRTAAPSLLTSPPAQIDQPRGIRRAYPRHHRDSRTCDRRCGQRPHRHHYRADCAIDRPTLAAALSCRSAASVVDCHWRRRAQSDSDANDRRALPEVEVITADRAGVNGDALEGVAFAILAYQMLRGKPGNIPTVTGARSAAILGKLTLPPART